MVKLYNVIDTRTGLHHSIAIVKEQNERWFVPFVEEESEEQIIIETEE